jgi:hypothetical protein
VPLVAARRGDFRDNKHRPLESVDRTPVLQDNRSRARICLWLSILEPSSCSSWARKRSASSPPAIYPRKVGCRGSHLLMAASEECYTGHALRPFPRLNTIARPRVAQPPLAHQPSLVGRVLQGETATPRPLISRMFLPSLATCKTVPTVECSAARRYTT